PAKSSRSIRWSPPVRRCDNVLRQHPDARQPERPPLKPVQFSEQPRHNAPVLAVYAQIRKGDNDDLAKCSALLTKLLRSGQADRADDKHFLTTSGCAYLLCPLHAILPAARRPLQIPHPDRVAALWYTR